MNTARRAIWHLREETFRAGVVNRLRLHASRELSRFVKLTWFLRDFGYDTELLGRDEIDERALTGLIGIVRTSRRVLGPRVFLNLEAFAPSSDWDLAVGVEKQKCEGIL